ncbi:DUF2971 domain-containing protein [Syntrophomonas erecta subsp. sporosyntropha]
MGDLIRFTTKEEYANQFLSGRIYMNSLSYFWSEGFEAQRDFSEGVIGTILKNNIVKLPQDLKDVLCYDIAVRADAYKYCNLCCFYRLDIETDDHTINLPPQIMSEFGEYAIIILDGGEFINRINNEIFKNQGWLFLYGDVIYHKRKDSRNPNNRIKHTLDLMMHEPIDINEFCESPEMVRYRDCFDKTSKYSYQREWRICLYRNTKKSTPCILEIGNISDIACIIKTKDLYQKLIEIYSGCYHARASKQRHLIKGNISRKHFRDSILKIDGKVWVMVTIG